MSDEKHNFLLKYGPDHYREKEINNTHIEDHGGEKRIFLNRNVIRSPLLSHDHTKKILQKDPSRLNVLVKDCKNLPDEVYEKYLHPDNDDHHMSKIDRLSISDNTPEKYLNQAIKQSSKGDIDNITFRRIIHHKNFTKESVHHLIDLKNENINYNIASNLGENEKFIDESHIKKMIDTDKNQYNGSVKLLLKNHYPNSNDIPDHIIDHLVNSEENHHESLFFPEKLKSHHFDKLLQSDADTRFDVARLYRKGHPEIKQHHVDTLKNDEVPYIKIKMKSNDNI